MRKIILSVWITLDGYIAGPDETYAPIWDAKFVNFSRRAPAIITEWISGAYFCDADTPESGRIA